MPDPSVTRDYEAAIAMAAKLQMIVEPLNSGELDIIDKSFNRQFVWLQSERSLADLYLRNRAAAILLAAIAVEQMDARVGGSMPKAGLVGVPTYPRANYFGIGADWDSDAAGSPVPFAAGTANWIHGGTAELGGAAGTNIRIGENGAHVIFGIGNLAPNTKPCKIETIEQVKDGATYPSIFPRPAWDNSEFSILEFDDVIFLKQGTTYRTRSRQRVACALADTVPFLVAISAINEPQLRIIDPTTLDLAANDLVAVG